MTKRVTNPEELGAVITEGEPTEVLYDLGQGDKRTELVITQIDGRSRISHRIASSPKVKLYEDGRMDIIDSDEKADTYSYKNIRPQEVKYESPTHRDELGDLEINLDGNKQLGITQFYRAE